MPQKLQNGSVSVPAKHELAILIKECRPVSFQDAIMSPTPKLEKISEAYGHDYAAGLVAATLTELTIVLSFDVSAPMIEAAADSIAQRWPDVRISDLKLFKTKVMSGEIGGQLYRLDARTFCLMFDEYYQKRFDVMDGLLDRKNTASLRVEGDGVLPVEQVVKAYDTLKAKAEKERADKKHRDKVKNMTLEEICLESKLPYQSIKDGIREQAETDFAEAGDIELVFETYLDILERKVLDEARKDRSVLNQFLTPSSTK